MLASFGSGDRCKELIARCSSNRPGPGSSMAGLRRSRAEVTVEPLQVALQEILLELVRPVAVVHAGIDDELRIDAALAQRLVEQLGAQDGHVPVVAAAEKQGRCLHLARPQQWREPVVLLAVFPRRSELPVVPLLVDVMAVVADDQAVPGAGRGRLEARRARDDDVGHVAAVRVAEHSRDGRDRRPPCGSRDRPRR